MKFINTYFMKNGGLIRFTAAFAFIFLGAILANAAPANDNFANAQVFSGNNGNAQSDNIGATKESNEPFHANNIGGKSIWFKYVATGDGVLYLDTNGSGFDTVIAVYTSGNNAGNGRLIAQNDDYDDANFHRTQSAVTIGTQAGRTYYIAVDGINKLDGAGAASGFVVLDYFFTNAAQNDNFASPIQLAQGNGSYSYTTTNVGASKEPNEPQHMGNAGGKSVWFAYTNDTNYPRSLSFTIDSRNAAANNQIETLFAVYSNFSLVSLTPVFDYTAGSSSITRKKFTFLAAPNTTYRIAIDGYDGGQGTETGTFTLTYGVTKDNRVADFDADGKADLAVFRPTDGNWYSLDSSTNNFRALHWGANGDKPLIASKDDATQNFTVFRPDTGIWYYKDSISAFYWGLNTDIPLIRNTRKADGTSSNSAAIFRPSTGTWWISNNNTSGTTINFGQAGDLPVSADFNGDGTDEYAVFRPSNGTWYISKPTGVPAQNFNAIQFGLNGDKPVVADYDADGRADVAVYRPSNGTWYVLRSSDGGFQATQFGISSDKPQPADYDGDGRSDCAVFRNGVWWILQSSNQSVRAIQWGLSSDIPVAYPQT